MSFSASRCASFAFGHVVVIDSYVKREVTRFRRSACLCEDERLRWRYFMRPPAIVGGFRDYAQLRGIELAPIGVLNVLYVERKRSVVETCG